MIGGYIEIHNTHLCDGMNPVSPLSNLIDDLIISNQSSSYGFRITALMHGIYLQLPPPQKGIKKVDMQTWT